MVAHTAYSGAWLPEVGKYKYTASHMFIDKKSIRNKKRRQEKKQKLLVLEHKLEKLKCSIIDDYIARNKLDSIRNFDEAILKQIDTTLDLIAERKKQIARPADHSYSNFEVEYGVKDGSSFGAVIIYDVDRFDYKYNYGNSAEFYFKQRLWQNDRFIISVAPRINLLHYSQANKKVILSNGLYLGRSSCNENDLCNFSEFGLNFSKGVGHNARKELAVAFSFQDGYKTASGLSLSSYSEMEYNRFSKASKEFRFFEQISIAKDIDFANLKANKMTLQVGYFWKGCLNRAYDTISGPVISLWLTI